MSDNDPGEFWMFVIMTVLGVPIFGFLIYLFVSVFLGAGSDPMP